MMGLGGANHLGIHARTCGSCVEKYYTSNFVRTGGHPYDDFNDWSLDDVLYVFAFLDLNSEVTCSVFFKILKPCGTFISGKSKVPLYD